MKAEYISHYLSDKDIANFARQSFGKTADGFTDAQNNNLIRYLARGIPSKDWEELLEEIDPSSTLVNRQGSHELAVYLRKIPQHWVPFGHPQITLRMQAPIPIRVQCFKHKIGYVESEESRRYISTRPEVFVPPFFRAKAENVKQGSDGEHSRSAIWLQKYQMRCEKAIQTYEDMVADGICPEQARFVLPQGCEVNWVWTGSLYAFANFFNQRSDSHAQKEIQELAKQVGDIIAPLFPVSWPALTAGEY